MSSGERTILRISKDISQLENALVLIDEVETGLHPHASPHFAKHQITPKTSRYTRVP